MFKAPCIEEAYFPSQSSANGDLTQPSQSSANGDITQQANLPSEMDHKKANGDGPDDLTQQDPITPVDSRDETGGIDKMKTWEERIHCKTCSSISEDQTTTFASNAEIETWSPTLYVGSNFRPSGRAADSGTWIGQPQTYTGSLDNIHPSPFLSDSSSKSSRYPSEELIGSEGRSSCACPGRRPSYDSSSKDIVWTSSQVTSSPFCCEPRCGSNFFQETVIHHRPVSNCEVITVNPHARRVNPHAQRGNSGPVFEVATDF